MCAISGVLDLPMTWELAEKMLSTMQLRGPDDQGVYLNDDIMLLHTRLAIIDPDKGRQPMELNWADERYVLVYNGELYNAHKLRRELIALGHNFQTHSDTEVVLHAYIQYGEACLDKFNGIFAFAVWESRKRKLFLARDRIGVKPLFYKYHQKGLIFSSEMKTILKYPTVRAELEPMGAAQLIMLGPGRAPGYGVFKDILELEPGCFGVYEKGSLKVRRYWKLTDGEHKESFEETSAYVRFLLQDAIVNQMVSDVPIGTFLSGGLDSSIITAVCAKEMHRRGERLKTFSVDYQKNDIYFHANKFQPNSDSDYIRLMQEALETDHQATVLSPEDLIGVLEEATIARDLPGMADVDFSLLCFCREIRKDVKVALSGECADEIFGGYPWYRDPEIREKQGFPWAQNTAQRVGLLTQAAGMDAEEFVMDHYRKTCTDSDVIPEASSQDRRMKEMVNLNFRWFMQTLLDRKDRMSMYSGLEVRVPFCDYRIAEYLYRIPWEMKDHLGREKGLLRHAVRDLLPEEILYRKKSPYPKTFDPAYEDMVVKRMETLLHKESPMWYMVDRNEIRKIMERESKWPWYGQLMRRPQTLAYFLQLDFWLRYYNVEFCF